MVMEKQNNNVYKQDKNCTLELRRFFIATNKLEKLGDKEIKLEQTEYSMDRK